MVRKNGVFLSSASIPGLEVVWKIKMWMIWSREDYMLMIVLLVHCGPQSFDDMRSPTPKNMGSRHQARNMTSHPSLRIVSLVHHQTHMEQRSRTHTIPASIVQFAAVLGENRLVKMVRWRRGWLHFLLATSSTYIM